jgi:hypothetical protein
VRHGGPQRFDRHLRIFIGVFDSGKALFLVVEEQARPVARHFDQRNAGIVDAGRRNAGKIDGLPAFDLVLDRTHAVARKAAFGSVDCQLAIIEFKQRQREVKPSRTEPWMAWSNPHAAVPPVQTLVSMIHRIRQAGWQLPVRRR